MQAALQKASSKQQGARTIVKNFEKSKEQAARSKEQGARSKQQAARRSKQEATSSKQ